MAGAATAWAPNLDTQRYYENYFDPASKTWQRRVSDWGMQADREYASNQAADKARQQALDDAATKRSQQLDDRNWAMGLIGGGLPGGGGGAGAGLAAVAGGGGGSYSPSAEDTSAETAARTASKENAALRLQSGLKGLKNLYSQRGISKSGLYADEAAGLFAGSNAEEAATDRDIISQRATRAADVSDRNFNANTQMQIAQFQAAAQERAQITNLLLQFGMRY